MAIEYDIVKNQSNIAKHGIDFEEAAKVFLDPDRFDRVDDRRDYGEERRICLGSLPVGGRVFVVAYTLRGENIRLISAEKAHERERHARYRRCE